MRASRLCREYYGLAADGRLPFPPPRRGGVSGAMQRRWRRFCARGWCGRAVTVCGYSGACVCAYAAVCSVVHVLHYRTINALFHPTEDYLLDDWRDVEPTLREGDIVLMRGVGLMSWAIATAQLALGVLHPAALRYSHVAVVVQPAEYASAEASSGGSCGVGSSSMTSNGADGNNKHGSIDGGDDADAASHLTASALLNHSIQHAQQQQAQQQQQRSRGTEARHSAAHGTPPRVADLLRAEASYMNAHHHRRLVRGAVILEAMDNDEFHVADIHGGRQYMAVQRVEATQRVCSRAADGRQAYAHFAVRRLRNFARTPAVVQSIRGFCEDNEGRPLDGSVLYVLSFVHARLYELLRPARFARKEVSCSELIMELYQMLGLVRRRWRWVRLTRAEEATYRAALAHGGGGGDCGSSNNTSTDDEQTRAMTTAALLPLPAPDDVARRRTGALHVYENCYARADVEAQRPLRSRSLPLVTAADTIEGEEDMLYATRAAPNTAATAADDALSTATTPTPTMLPPRRAGDVALDKHGRLRQLRWYYRHNSLQTSPYQFTEGVDTSVIDWMPGYSLGQEIRMQIPTTLPPHVRDGDNNSDDNCGGGGSEVRDGRRAC